MLRKLVVFLCVFSILFLLSACSSLKDEEETPPRRQEEEKITTEGEKTTEPEETIPLLSDPTEPEETEPEPTEPTEPEVTETQPVTEPVLRGPGAENAMDYIQSLYQDNGNKTYNDFDRYCIVRVGGVQFDVQWSVDVNKTLVEIVPGEDGIVTIDINEECQEDTPYVLTATITDAAGNVATYSWNYILPKAQDMVEIVEAAYALASGESLPYQVTLTGTVTEIDTPYDSVYGNISVVIQVEGYPQYPILCYRLKGTGVDHIAVNDRITVTGILTNYEGTVEFDIGCIMTERISGSAT